MMDKKNLCIDKTPFPVPPSGMIRSTPSPLGEGWDGGPEIKNERSICWYEDD
jgi:hypothetical protein